MVRDCVQENSLENISPDPVQSTVPKSGTYPQASSFDSKSEDREEEIAEPLCTDGSAPALEIPEEQERRYLHSRISKVNKKELWEASQFI